MARHRAADRSTSADRPGPADRSAAHDRSAAYDRFGGVDPVAVVAGTMAAVGSVLLLSALVGAVVGIGYRQGTGEDEISTTALAAGLLVLGLSLLFGGYVSGRVARYAGKRNGLLSGLGFVLLSAVLAALATQSEQVRDLDLPQFVDGRTLRDLFSVATLASAVTALSVALGGAALGGRQGAGYHRRVDAALLAEPAQRPVPGTSAERPEAPGTSGPATVLSPVRRSEEPPPCSGPASP